ncbi:MAG: hypothetical protein A3E00_08705 [Curvibacter sp. RIFCSPHIGHO2_12_FULL_63_18]|nr:MAG: hypothetical protein A2037_03470 [Curvibacter sp. GWA2_63_95]OGP03683.1 MAG: hypothetical protein A3E00_08705 [Curvibacter sp. RIFCSPHIGHO2_12_FULL_63_18]
MKLSFQTFWHAYVVRIHNGDVLCECLLIAHITAMNHALVFSGKYSASAILLRILSQHIKRSIRASIIYKQ